MLGTCPRDDLWLMGVVTSRISPTTYTLQVNDSERFAHADHLRPRTYESQGTTAEPARSLDEAFQNSGQAMASEAVTPTSVSLVSSDTPALPRKGQEPCDRAEATSGIPDRADTGTPNKDSPSGGQEPPEKSSEISEVPKLRRSTRVHRPPDRYQSTCLGKHSLSVACNFFTF